MSARVALKWNDSLIVLNHASTDRSLEILEEVGREHPGRVHVITESNPNWSEMAHRQRLLDAARDRHATHVSLVDADEVLSANQLPSIRQHIEVLQPGQYLQAGMPCMWRSLDHYRTDSRIWSNRFDLTLVFCDSLSLSWRADNGYEHHHRQPYGVTGCRRLYGTAGGVMHLQFAPWRRLVAKHVHYRIMEKLKYPNRNVADIDRMYSLATDEWGLQTAPAPADWWAGYENLRRYVNLEAEPWHEQESRRLIDLHGMRTFEGLNLSGLCLSPSL